MAEFKTETGTVKWFNQTKGFCFITRPGQKDIFVNVSVVNEACVESELMINDVAVEFQSGLGRRGPQVAKIFMIGNMKRVDSIEELFDPELLMSGQNKDGQEEGEEDPLLQEFMSVGRPQ